MSAYQCPQLKRSYGSYAQATAAAASLAKTYGKPYRAYRCSECGDWHTGSHDRKVKGGKPLRIIKQPIRQIARTA